MAFKNQAIKDIATRNAIIMLTTRIEVLESKVQDLLKEKRIEEERRLIQSHEEDQME